MARCCPSPFGPKPGQRGSSPSPSPRTRRRKRRPSAARPSARHPRSGGPRKPVFDGGQPRSAGQGAAPEDKQVAGVKFFAQVVSGVTGKDLPPLIDEHKARMETGAVLLIADAGDKAAVAAGVTQDLTGVVSAVDLVRAAVTALGGKGGGGRPDMAQGGARDASNAEAAAEADIIMKDTKDASPMALSPISVQATPVTVTIPSARPAAAGPGARTRYRRGQPRASPWCPGRCHETIGRRPPRRPPRFRRSSCGHG